jgi:hypothetical protein
MTRDYLSIGPTPAEEPCEQVPYSNPTAARNECANYIRHLQRHYNVSPADSTIQYRVKSNPHDFGAYYEVAIYFDDDDDDAVDLAYEQEDGLGFWLSEEVGTAFADTQHLLVIEERLSNRDYRVRQYPEKTSLRVTISDLMKLRYVPEKASWKKWGWEGEFPGYAIEISATGNLSVVKAGETVTALSKSLPTHTRGSVLRFQTTENLTADELRQWLTETLAALNRVDKGE